MTGFGQAPDGQPFTTRVPVSLDGERLLERLETRGVAIEAVATKPSAGEMLVSFLVSVVPFVALLGLYVWMGRRAEGQFAGIPGAGRSRAKVFDSERPHARFADVAGYDGVKREIAEIVDFLRQPDRFRRAGAVAPRGVLMAGPPGTGKTLLARAVAGEAEVPFLSVTGSSFVEMFVGVGAARVRDLFAEARKRAPAIIFIDEIDAIGQRRSTGAVVSHDEREQTLNQLLAEMDGFDPLQGIVVLAATNRPEILDAALLRPGRFDRQVVVPLPNQAERRAILDVHGRGKHLAPDVDLDVVARGTPGFSGADLANLVNEAAIFAVRRGRETITAEDLRDSLAVRLGGRAAELTVLGEGSTGAANDLATATDLATKMVREYGLSREVGPVGYPTGSSQFLPGGPEFAARPYAEATQRVIDAEVARLLREAEERALKLLSEHRNELDRLTAMLLEHETVDGESVYRLVGRNMPTSRSRGNNGRGPDEPVTTEPVRVGGGR